MKIALIFAATNAVLQVWSLSEGEEELAIRYTLPDGNQLSPIKPGWAKNGYSIVAVTEFEVPEGHGGAAVLRHRRWRGGRDLHRRGLPADGAQEHRAGPVDRRRQDG